MQNAKLKNYLHLHLLVFIAGFTAILGELISVGAIQLVWFRMGIAIILVFGYLFFKQIKLNLSPQIIAKFFMAGCIIALHWITFFEAINQSNVSITLAMYSTGTFFASFIEPLLFKRKIVVYELVLGVLVVAGVMLITKTELNYLVGILLGLVSAFLSTLFTVINGMFIKKHHAVTISFYEFMGGFIFLTIYVVCFGNGFTEGFFKLSLTDACYLFILGSVCTAYAFIGAVKVMRYLSPYTVVIVYNLEPVYGIILAVLLFPNSELMSAQFYLGTALIMTALFLDAFFKRKPITGAFN